MNGVSADGLPGVISEPSCKRGDSRSEELVELDFLRYMMLMQDNHAHHRTKTDVVLVYGLSSQISHVKFAVSTS